MKKGLFFAFLLMMAAVICFASAASAAGTVTLSDRVTYSTGITRISWDVSGAEADTYKVYAEVTGKGNSKQMTMYLGETTNHTLQTNQCIPGLTYKFTITDGSYTTLDEKEITLPSPDIFSDGKLRDTSIKVSIEPRMLKAGDMISKDTKKVNNLKAADIMAGIDDGTASYGVKYTMRMPQLKEARSFFVTVAFESPEGFVYTWYADDMEFERVNRGYQTIWFYMAGSDFFRELYKTTGEIPIGKYSIYLFWDGMWVNKIDFNVR